MGSAYQQLIHCSALQLCGGYR